MHRFDDVEVDEDLGEVRVAGTPRPIEPQVFSVLAYLIGQRHRVVPKEELLDEVWGSRFVSAAAITSRIKSARQAIGDSGRDQRCIRTVHGRGYRFVADLVDPGGVDGQGEPATSTARAAPPDLAPPTPTLDDGWPLIGRDSELAQIVATVAMGERGGMLLTGPAGLGKTRLARAAIETAAADGIPVARINGHAAAAGVPLAALAHLLPSDVTDVAGLQGEMARTVLFQRARTAIGVLAGGDRLVLMIDDVDRVDGLSLALVGSLIAEGTVFALMTQRVDGDAAPAMDQLIRSGRVGHVQLGPVPADQLTALLGRVLDGPVEPATTEALVAAAGGNPGVLRQLVEASTATGVLHRRGEMWRLRGRVSPPGDMAAAIGRRIADLEPEQRDALELLALAGDLDLDLAFELVADEVLDRLELEGMITVREIGPTARVRLAHPLYGEILAAEVSSLRLRRHRGRLVAALASHGAASAADRLQLVRLQLDADADIDDEMLLESATIGLIEGDTGLTLRLLGRVESSRRTARHQQLLGEALYQRGRFVEAGEVLQAIDTDELDADAAAFVVRRIATWMFYGSWRHDEALDYLRTNIDRFDGAPRATLESYWVMIAGLDGRHTDEALHRAADGGSATTTYARVDYLSGAAMARFVRGEFLDAAGLLEECNRIVATLERSLTWTGPDFANFVEMMAHVQLGRPDAAQAVLERRAGKGNAPPFGFMALAAGRAALMAGRYQQVLDWLDPHIQIADALGIVTNGRPLQASSSLAALALGDRDRAVEEARLLRADLPAARNLTTLDIEWAVLQVEAATGDRGAAVAGMLTAAATARQSNNRYIESMLLTAAAWAGAPEQTLDRLDELSAVMHGDIPGLRYRQALALSGRDDVETVATELEGRGLCYDALRLRAAGS
jgi:DNA-binding winged helix-turn-helix (wHTH) protein/tetratricopeptide (TPR) repeat protein